MPGREDFDEAALRNCAVLRSTFWLTAITDRRRTPDRRAQAASMASKRIARGESAGVHVLDDGDGGNVREFTDHFERASASTMLL